MIKKILVILLIFVFSSLGIVWGFFYYPETVGHKPEGELLQKIKQSPNYSQKREGFENRQAEVIDKMFDKYSFIDSFMRYYAPTNVGWPRVKIKELKDDLQRFEQMDIAPIYTWLGHSTILVRVENRNILIDPVFSDFASPLNFIARRFQAPIYSLEELPPIDMIVISHDHYDHLDYKTIQFFKNSQTKFIVPLGVDSHLLHWGVKKTNITSFDWWDEKTILDLKFIATPAQHMSGRDGFVGYQTLWAGWIIQSEKWKLFYSGDSGYDLHFKQIGDKYGPFDLAFLENGQYNERWHAVHLMPQETAQAYKDVKAKRMFPVHWGMFNLSLHHWFDPPIDLGEYCKDCNIDYLPLGKIQSLNEEQSSPNEMLEFLMNRKKKVLQEI